MTKVVKAVAVGASFFAAVIATDLATDSWQAGKGCVPDLNESRTILNTIGDFGGLIDPDGDGCLHGYKPA